MKLAIFGATGRTGQRHRSSVAHRDGGRSSSVDFPFRLRQIRSSAHVVAGDVNDSEAVRQTVAGADAVISVLGHGRGHDYKALRTGSGHIVAAMREAGVRRLVVLSITAVRDPEDRPRWADRLLETVGRVLAAGVYADHLGQAETVRGSRLEWTIVRAPLLTEGPHTGSYRVGHMGEGLNASRLACGRRRVPPSADRRRDIRRKSSPWSAHSFRPHSVRHGREVRGAGAAGAPRVPFPLVISAGYTPSRGPPRPLRHRLHAHRRPRRRRPCHRGRRPRRVRRRGRARRLHLPRAHRPRHHP